MATTNHLKFIEGPEPAVNNGAGYIPFTPDTYVLTALDPGANGGCGGWVRYSPLLTIGLDPIPSTVITNICPVSFPGRDATMAELASDFGVTLSQTTPGPIAFTANGVGYGLMFRATDTPYAYALGFGPNGAAGAPASLGDFVTGSYQVYNDFNFHGPAYQLLPGNTINDDAYAVILPAGAQPANKNYMQADVQFLTQASTRYTTTRIQFYAHIVGAPADNDAGHYNRGYLSSFGLQFPIWFIPPSGTSGAGPANLARPRRDYLRTEAAKPSGSADTTGINFWRSIRPCPKVHVPDGASTPTLWDNGPTALTTTAKDNSPRLAGTSRGDVICVFNRPDSGAMLAFSKGDDGNTWEAPFLAITGGRHPNILSSQGHLLVAAATGPAGGSCVIQGRTRGPGEAVFSAPFTFTMPDGSALSVSDDSFGLAQAAEGPSRIILHVLIFGETATSEWWSADDGRTWTRIPTS